MAERVAVVTGAGSGIGRASALALLADGYAVALAGRRREALDETAQMAKAGRPLPVPTDVADPGSVAALFAAVEGALRAPGRAVQQCRGQCADHNFGDLTFEQWKSVVDVNLNGMFLCANAAFRLMREQSPQGGRIINNGSISAHTPRPGSARVHDNQARNHRAYKDDLPRWSAIRYRVQSDRYRQCRHADDATHELRGCRSRTARRWSSPGWMWSMSHARSCSWRICRSIRMCSSSP